MRIDLVQLIAPTEIIDLSAGENESKKEGKNKKGKGKGKKKEKKKYDPDPYTGREYEIDERWIIPKQAAKDLFSHEDLVFLRNSSTEEQEKRIQEIIEKEEKGGN